MRKLEIISYQQKFWKNLFHLSHHTKEAMWDIDQMKPLSATVVLSLFIHSELSPFYGIIREDDKIFALWF